MKKICKRIIIALLLLLNVHVYGQTRITLQPGSIEGIDAFIYDYNPDSNLGDHPDFIASAWTAAGSEVIVRSFIKFDLDTIPSNAIICSAKLSLYSYDSPHYGTHSTLSGSNKSYLQRVLQDWEENTITWNNQPQADTVNIVQLAPSIGSIQDYTNIDVTNLIRIMSSDSIENYGLMFSLDREEYYRKMVFGSSDNLDSTLHPKLEISYIDPITIYDTITVYDTIMVYDSISVTDTLIIDIEITDSKKHAKNEIKVYPNPTKDIVYINNGDYTNLSNYVIRIISSNSRVVYESKINQEILEVNISDFGAIGLYFIQVLDDNSNLINTKKILLE